MMVAEVEYSKIYNKKIIRAKKKICARKKTPASFTIIKEKEKRN